MTPGSRDFLGPTLGGNVTTLNAVATWWVRPEQQRIGADVVTVRGADGHCEPDTQRRRLRRADEAHDAEVGASGTAVMLFHGRVMPPWLARIAVVTAADACLPPATAAHRNGDPAVRP